MSGKRFEKNRIVSRVGLAVACLAVLTLIIFLAVRLIRNSQEEARLNEFREETKDLPGGQLANVSRGPDTFGDLLPGPDVTPTPDAPLNQDQVTEPSATPTVTPTPRPIEIQQKMLRTYNENNDLVGKLYIPGTGNGDPRTEINYPVMQTFDDPSTPDVNENEYYINRGLDKKILSRGSLFMDYRSVSGEGYVEDNYAGGVKPTNIMMIYGHNMGTGEMFGFLYYFLNTDYAEKHKYIEYDTLFEHRRYEVVSAFRSHVFTVNDYMDYSRYDDPNFKYYQFCGDLTEDKFVYWYSNVVSHNENGLPEYNASYDDEFLVLSTCSGTDETGARNEDGRLCVVAVRIE